MPFLRWLRLTPHQGEDEEEAEEVIFLIGMIQRVVDWWLHLVTRALRLVFLSPILCLFSCTRWTHRKVLRTLEWGKEVVKALFLKLVNLGITVGLIIVFPAMFLVVVPLYARRFVCRFQAT